MAGLPDAFGIDADSLVVIAPHPDDDVLGCGALIARATRSMPVSVVYVTDGAASHTGSPTYPAARLAAVREEEARRALRCLGVAAPPRFLRWPDGTVPGSGEPDAAALIAEISNDIPVDENIAVLAPWRRDPHVDHRAVASLVAAVMRERPRASLIEYAVWLGVRGDIDGDAPRPYEGVIVDVDSHPWLPAKRAALQEHRSQLGSVVTDAVGSFELPTELLQSALGPVERFVISAPRDFAAKRERAIAELSATTVTDVRGRA